MSLSQAAAPSFAGHQTFHPRFGWLKKGFDRASEDPAVFLSADATVRLGVGKNMVEAIRHWTLATHVLSRIPDPSRPRTSLSVPTNLGHALLSEDGFDPYFEDPTTLWILHWQLCSPPAALPVWYLAFGAMTALEFDEADLLAFCQDEVSATTWAPPMESSLRKDVDCLLRMYTSRKARGRQTLDDLLDSPFRELGLVRHHPVEKDRYRFVRGWKPGLTPTAVAYACLDYQLRVDPSARTASVARLASDPGSPGQLMKLTEHEIVEALEATAKAVHGIRLAAPGGAVQMVLDEPADRVAVNLLVSRVHSLGRNPEGILDAVLVGHEARQPTRESLQMALP